MSETETKIELKKLVSVRGQLKSQLTRFANFVNDISNISKTMEMLSRVERIEQAYNEFCDVQSQIELLDADNPDEQYQERVNFEDKYFSACGTVKQIINDDLRAKRTPPTPVATAGALPLTVTQSNAQFNIQLPPVTLPEFDGTYDKWSNFHDTFVSLIHNNTGLPNIQKYYYLQSILKGEALKVIDSLEVNDSNYLVAWSLLIDRFENKKFIIRGHVKHLFDLPSIDRESYTSLRSFFDTFQKHYRALKNLNEPIDSWSTILIYLLVSKLDKSSNRDWEIKMKGNDSPSVSDFLNFLNERCQVLESIEGSKITLQTQNMKPKERAHVYAATSDSYFCTFCNKQNHTISFCKSLLKLSTATRIFEIKKLKLCTNCLKAGHNSFNCTSSSCKTCGKRHHTILHLNKPQGQVSNSKEVSHSQTSQVSSENEGKHISNNHKNEASVATCSHISEISYPSVSSHNYFTILSTALVYLYDKECQPVLCRALLDSGSQSNFITNDLAKRLNLKAKPVDIPVVGINASSTNISKIIKTKMSSTDLTAQFNLEFLVINKITENIPQCSFDCTNLNIPKELNLADPQFNVSSEIDILLGSNIFYNLLLQNQFLLGRNQPILQKTKLGWVIAGPCQINTRQTSLVCNFVQAVNMSNIESQLERFWSIEDCSHKQAVYSKEEQNCEEHFQNNFERNEYNEFVVKLPFKENFSSLGQSRDISIQRFQTLERKLSKNTILKNKYINFINEYIQLEHMSPVEPDEIFKDNVCYLPHHCVFKDSSATTKLRVVFDASSKTTSNLSLNDVLMVGPCIQEPIFWILLRFRIHPIVFTADITKMYRCVLMHKNDRDYQRIVWRPNPTEELIDYKLNTVTYGTSPASFLATRCLKQLALEKMENFPNASQSILTDFYMDDWLSGSKDFDSALELVKNVNNILSSAGFNLRQWASNDRRIMEYFKCIGNTTNNQYVIKDNEGAKTLGILWNSYKDNFQFTVNSPKQSVFTKRIILSIVSQIFDVLGLLAPVIVKAKIILQGLWQSKIGWDEQIPETLLNVWVNFYKNINALNNVYIPRLILLPDSVNMEIHCFSDASQVAYGACIYFRSQNVTGNVLVRLACAKSRVAPLKTVTLPRLELCGALLAVQLCQTVLNSIKFKVNDIFYWCDSTIVLSWISCEPSRLKTFVSNRVAQIQSHSSSSQWHHVRTNLNPADLVSRGMNPDEIVNSSFWFNGPEWLGLDKEFWPKNIQYDEHVTEIPEIKTNTQTFLCTDIKNDAIIYNYSSLTKLLRILAYITRFIKNAKLKPELRFLGGLTTNEIDNSTKLAVKIVQRNVFGDELRSLKTSSSVSRTSKLVGLNPFLDDFGILRVGGRLENSNLSFEDKHPIILPAKHHFTTLVIRHEHLKNLHAGPQVVLANVRNIYWPLGGRRTVRSILHKCITCFRASPSKSLPKMGNLPSARVTPSAPFSVCGVDYAGPYEIKDSKLRNKAFLKSYICVFVCFSTKAVHLELVTELSTDSFLNAFKRFVARRGLCTDIYSDNATNFLGAKRSLTEFVNQANEVKFKNFLVENKISWHFIPPRSPHFGGLWESAVRLMKHHLKRIMHGTYLTYENFYSIIVQVESILNSRPLCPLTEDPEDLEILTPGHFLIGRSLISFPEATAPANRQTHVIKYRHMKFMLQQFWSKWSKAYLHSLQERSKWKLHKGAIPIKGSLVLLNEENMPPMSWKIGRVQEVHPGNDGTVRVVTVKTIDGIYKRAVTKISVLPIDL